MDIHGFCHMSKESLQCYGNIYYALEDFYHVQVLFYHVHGYLHNVKVNLNMFMQTINTSMDNFVMF
jgi:hypothetical protein